MAVQSNNDWDPLEEIFVGTAKGAVLPTMDPSVRSFSYATYSEEELKGLEGPHDKQIMEEAEETFPKKINSKKSATFEEDSRGSSPTTKKSS